MSFLKKHTKLMCRGIYKTVFEVSPMEENLSLCNVQHEIADRLNGYFFFDHRKHNKKKNAQCPAPHCLMSRISSSIFIVDSADDEVNGIYACLLLSVAVT